jgi:DNA repair exonuclease SbcCD ATPase subunit
MIDELTLQGFKSYKRRQTIKFTQGVNKISGRNASGKTSLLEAIIFGLFGDVPKVSKQDLLPLNGGNLSVTVKFRSPLTGQSARIHREGSSTKDGGYRGRKVYLDVEGENHAYTREGDIQGKLRELLGVGKGTFLNVVYARQKEFVEILNPSKNRMDAILGLTAPTEIREQLRETRRQLEVNGKISEKGALEERVRNAEKNITEAEEQTVQVNERLKEINQGLSEKRDKLIEASERVEKVEILHASFRKLERYRGDLDVIQGRREDREQELDEACEALGAHPDDVRKEITSRRDKAIATEERLSGMLDEELSIERRELDGSISRLRHQLNEHQGLMKQGLTVCPKCGQPIDHNLLEEDVKKWGEDLEIQVNRLRGLEQEYSQVRDQVRSSRDRRIRAERELEAFNSQELKIGELRSMLTQLDTQAVTLAARIRQESEGLLFKAEDEMGLSFADLEDAQNRITEKLNDLNQSLGRLEGEVRTADRLIRESERQLADIQRRIEGYHITVYESKASLESILEYESKLRVLEAVGEHYKSYEAVLRENTLKSLEWLTYKYFERLTDQQVYSGCYIDRDRYILEVLPQGSGRLIPAWRAGGGHESLLALAERLALLRVKEFPYLLILDEPTDAVDSENVPQLIEYIAKSSNEIGQVLLVTHHGQGEEEGVNLIRVRKTAGESTIRQESDNI